MAKKSGKKAGRKSGIKLGLNLFLWSGQTNEALFPVLDKVKKWGFDGVELPLFHTDEAVYQRVRAKLDDLGLGCTGCTVSLPDKNPISDSDIVRQAGIQNLKDMLRMCHVLGAEVLCGPLVYPLGALVGRGRTQEEWQRAVQALTELGPYAEEMGVTVALEYLNRFETYFINTAADLKALIMEVNHPRIRLMFDTFHANIEEKSTYKAAKSCGKHLAHVHISENDRGVPGSGHVAWKEAFKALREIKYKGWLTIESFGQTVPEIAAAAAIWRPLFKDNDEVAKKGIKFMKGMLAR